MVVRLVDQVGERSMALDEHCWGELNGEKATELRNAISLVFAAAIGKEDEGDPEMLKQRKSLSSVWEWIGRPEEYTVDTTDGC